MHACRQHVHNGRMQRSMKSVRAPCTHWHLGSWTCADTSVVVEWLNHIWESTINSAGLVMGHNALDPGASGNCNTICMLAKRTWAGLNWGHSKHSDLVMLAACGMAWITFVVESYRWDFCAAAHDWCCGYGCPCSECGSLSRMRMWQAAQVRHKDLVMRALHMWRMRVAWDAGLQHLPFWLSRLCSLHGGCTCRHRHVYSHVHRRMPRLNGMTSASAEGSHLDMRL